MKVLITGSGGFIGRNLAEYFGGIYEVRAPKRRELNLLEEEAVAEYLQKEKPDVVIHAANVNTSRNLEVSDYESLNGNLQMFYHLEKHHDLYGKMYYFGSGAEYDMRNYVPDMKEEYFGEHIPQDSYGFSKYVMSRQTDLAKNIYDLRLFGVYGKYEEWEHRFISNAICRVLCGLPITICQNVYFDYLWVDDLARIMRWFIENTPKYRHYNVCRGEKIDLVTLAHKVRACLQTDCEIQVAMEGYKREYTGDNARLLGEIGQFPFTSFDEAVEQLADFYRENIHLIDRDRLF